jgi:hypothetical protein
MQADRPVEGGRHHARARQYSPRTISGVGMTAPLALAVANAVIMAAVALAGARTPHWLHVPSWLLLAWSLVVLALHLVGDAWDIPANALAIAFLVSTCLNASTLAPLIMQGLLARPPRSRRRMTRTE